MIYGAALPMNMPLANSIIIKLNQITEMIPDKSSLNEGEIAGIKKIFQEALSGGERYDAEEIESWLENEGSWNSRQIRVRIANLSHYVQSRYEQGGRFKMMPDDSCGC